MKTYTKGQLMNHYFAILMAISIFFTSQTSSEELIKENSINEFVIFKVQDSSKGIEIARSIVKDIKSFNDGVIADKLYQSVNDPTVITQCITWKSLEKAKEASAAFDTFPSAIDFFNQSGEVIFFDHFKQIK